MLRINLPHYGQHWNLPKEKILAVIPESLIGQALQTEPDITQLDIIHPDVKSEAMDVIANYLEGKEPLHSIPGLAPSANYLNLPLLYSYRDPMYDSIVANPLYLDMFLEQAAREGNIHMVSYLLQKGANPVKTITPDPYSTFPKLFPKLFAHQAKPYSFSQPLRNAVESGQLNVVKLLLADPRMMSLPDLPNVLQDALELAVNAGQVDIAQYLLILAQVDPEYLQEHLIPLAVEGDDIQMVKLLLAQGPIPYQENKGLESAIGMDHLDIIDLYLHDPGFEPYLHYYLSKAAESSSPEAVQKFLAADPSPYDNDILKDAIRHDRPEIVKLLLADPRVDPSSIVDEDRSLLEFIQENPETETVQIMRADGRLPARFFVIPE